MRAQQAYLQAEDERGAARVVMLERTSELAASFRDKFLSPILKRGDHEDEAADGRTVVHDPTDVDDPDRDPGADDAPRR